MVETRVGKGEGTRRERNGKGVLMAKRSQHATGSFSLVNKVPRLAISSGSSSPWGQDKKTEVVSIFYLHISPFWARFIVILLPADASLVWPIGVQRLSSPDLCICLFLLKAWEDAFMTSIFDALKKMLVCQVSRLSSRPAGCSECTAWNGHFHFQPSSAAVRRSVDWIDHSPRLVESITQSSFSPGKQRISDVHGDRLRSFFPPCTTVFTLKYLVPLIEEAFAFTIKSAPQLRLYFIPCTQLHT